MAPAREYKQTVKQERIAIIEVLKVVDDIAQDTAVLQALRTVMDVNSNAEPALSTMRSSQSLVNLLTLSGTLGSLPREACLDRNAISRFEDDLRYYRTRSLPGRRRACARCSRRGKKVSIVIKYHKYLLITVPQCVLNHEGTACVSCLEASEECHLPSSLTKVWTLLRLSY